MPRLPILIGVFVLALPPLESAQPAGAAEPMPLCIYDGGSYSEGAHICGQPSLMMACSMVGEHAVWKVVTDRDISRLCVTPSGSATSRRSHRHVARRMPSKNTAASIDPPAASSAKCFTFNGKRFCE